MNVVYQNIKQKGWLSLLFCLLMVLSMSMVSHAQVRLSAGCTTGTADLSGITAANQPANTTLTWHSGTPATTANKLSSVTALSPGTYYAAFFDAVNDCYSSSTLDVTVTAALCLNNVCPAITVNLNTAVSVSNLPANTVLTWHTSLPATTANKIADPTTVGLAGTYFAAFYDATNDCYSGGGNAATEVIVTITSCAPTCADAGTAPFAAYVAANPTSVIALADCDNDGLSNVQEIDPDGNGTPGPNGTDPSNPDTDGDGLNDGDEATEGTNPNDADSDDDGINDGNEVNGTGPLAGVGPTNPLDADTDNDGIQDGTEAGVTTPVADPDGAGPLLGTNPAVFVPDADPTTTTNPNDLDSDDDGLADGAEDTNANGAVNGSETDADDADTDNDGVQDGTELGITTGVADPDGAGPLAGTNPATFVPDADPTTTTNPLNPDTDGDGLTDGAEDANGNGLIDGAESDPNDPCDPFGVYTVDTDGDGLTDCEEQTGMDDPSTPADPNGIPTDPNNPDTDGDGLNDGDEATEGTNPNDADSDDDGINDGNEVNGTGPLAGVGPTNPLDADTDNDGIQDGTEAGVTTPVADPDGAGPLLGTNPAVFVPDADPTTTTNPNDLDSDDDGLADGAEDTNANGAVNGSETDADDADTDNDGVQDGTELGITTGVADPDGAGPLAGTNPATFVPDADPTTTTNPLNPDTDGDGLTDGAEDANGNGLINSGETDPNNPDTDGDGVQDGSDIAPLDPCTPTQLAGYTGYVASSTIWSAEDCDSDGALNGQEVVNNTDPYSPNAILSVKVLLQGALFGTNDSLMRDDLRVGNRIPFTEPYTVIGASNPRFVHFGAGGGETTTPAVLSANAGTKDAIVDWVFVELRSAANSSVVVETRAALVQRDGDVVNPADGVSALRFDGLIGQQYFVAVKHRNHLGAMIGTPITMSYFNAVADFLNATAGQVYNRPGAIDYDGLEMYTTSRNTKALWSGNTNANTKVKYQGTSSDNNLILAQVLSHPANTLGTYNFNNAFGYYAGDVNMDGKVKYQGTQADPSFIFINMIGLYGLNIMDLYNYDLFLEQLPD